MDLSASEKAISDLEGSLNSLGDWLAFFTALVVIGLIVEYAEDFMDLIIKRPFNWRLFRTMVGGFLITAGVAGELVVGFHASSVETELRAANGKVIAALTKEAGDAQISAKDAAGAASLADSSAQRANSEAGNAQKRARDVEAQAQELRRKSLELAQELATMEKAAFPRHLGQTEFAAKIKPFKGFPVSVETISDFEARRTAALIQGGLHLADWQVGPIQVRNDPASLPDFFFPGVAVAQNCGNDPTLDSLRSSPDERKKSLDQFIACTKAFESLVKELSDNGIEAHQSAPAIDIPRNTIRVRVALKPMPGQPGENLIVGP